MSEKLTPTPTLFDEICELSVRKAAYSSASAFLLAICAGCYVGLGAMLSVYGGGGLSDAVEPGVRSLIGGAFGYPMGLGLVVILGGDLFTGNVSIMLCGWLTGRFSWQTVLKNWIIVYLGNFMGALWVAGLCYWSDIMPYPSLQRQEMIYLGVSKTSRTFSVEFIRGWIANWLVCSAVWQSVKAKDVTGKILGVFFPIMAFVVMGLEHCIANLFVVPSAIFMNGDVSWGSLFYYNQLPVILGNICGPSVMMSFIYWLIQGKNSPFLSEKCQQNTILRAIFYPADKTLNNPPKLETSSDMALNTFYEVDDKEGCEKTNV